MILSMLTDFSSTVTDDKKLVELIAKAGFDAVDFSMFKMRNDSNVLNTPEYKKHVLEVKKIADENGVFFNQAHSPFPSYIVDDEKYNTVIFDRIKRSIEIAGILGVRNIVVHPTDFKEDSDINIEKNREFYNRLIPFAEEYGVKIAVENMFGHDRKRDYIIPNICSLADEFSRMMDKLDPQYFTACLDIGHAGLVGTTAQDMIRGLGHEKLTCLHVHDNNYRSDWHTAPYFGELDWDEIAKALADIDYSGDFTYESSGFITELPAELVLSGLKFLNDIGHFIIDKIESYR